MATPYKEDEKLFTRESIDGEYTTYTHILTNDFGALTDIRDIYVNNKGTIYFEEGNALGAGTLTRGGVVTYLGAFYTWYQAWYLSATFKYLMDIGWVGAGIPVMIQRDAAVLMVLNLLLDEVDAASIQSASISPSGRYLAFAMRSIATANDRYLMLYEGS